MAMAGRSTFDRIYAVVRRIPKGRVATYGQVAALAGLAGRPRLTGYALHAASGQGGLPWHRVINAQGRISLMGLDPTAATTQRLRLEAEGVPFDARGRVDLGRFGWRPRTVPARAASKGR